MTLERNDPCRSNAVRRCLALLAACLFGGVTLHVSAQTLCIPATSGVPALSGPPNWHQVALGEPNYWPRLDDPRWRGSLARSFGVGSSEHVSFRTLRDGSAVYMSWYVKVDPNLDPFLDSLRVAFSPGGAAADVLIEVFPFTDAATNLVAAVPPSTQTRLRTGAGGTWVTQPSEPTWLAQAAGFGRVWLDVANQTWAVNLRVPIDPDYNDGINLSNDFRVWFELQVSVPDGADPGTDVDLTYYRLDNNLDFADIEGGTNATTWPQFSRTLAPGSPGCVRGVSIASSDVGTQFVDAASVPRPNRMSLSNPNTFFALPLNETGGNIPASQISGTFRIANWGTQPDWNDIPNPTTSLWLQINSTPVTNAGAIANGAKASVAGGNALTFAWTPTAAERCMFVGTTGVPANQTPDGVAIPGDPTCPNTNPLRRLHQCMLVELSGGGLTYTPDSTYRNMDFVDSSTFTREAEVSVAGLVDIPGETQRDVYLYVKTQQMPASLAQPGPPDLLRDLDKLRDILSQRPDPDRDRERSGPIAEIPPAAGAGEEGEGEGEDPPRPPLNGDFDTLDQVYPTYVVHAYHDTGETVTVRGAQRRVLQSQSSFGYYVHHQGEMTGWSHSLDGATQIKPDYFRVAAPNGGAAVVKTTINALEKGRPWWWLWLILFLLLLIIAYAIYRARSSSP